MSEADKTVRMVTNLDRSAVEGKLAAARQAAESANLPQVAAMLKGLEGQPRAQIETRVESALKALGDNPEHQRIVADLELVEINLKNLK